jgi:outer membrane lipoprotein-sorting protein
MRPALRIAAPLALAVLAALGPRAASPQAAPNVAELLAAYLHAADDPAAAELSRVQSSGTLAGAGLTGAFATWQDGDRSREDEALGPRRETTLRLGQRVFFANADGNVREFTGIMLRRDRTEQFIDSGDFAKAPERCTARGRVVVGGRATYALDVTAPGGEPQTIYLDAQTFLPARVAYDDDDGRTTVDFSDWRSVAGHRFPYRAVVSDGDHAFDVTQTTERIDVGGTVDPAVFAPLVARTIEMTAPQTIRVSVRDGHIFVPVTIGAKEYTFLLDSGAQNVLIDSRVARDAGLSAVGALQASGAQRTGGLQLARLDAMRIGNGTLHGVVATTLDLGRSTEGAFRIDGILGYPFFAEAVVTIDSAASTMTFGPPGSFEPSGTKLRVETDRAFPEARVRFNGSIDGAVLVDTGNAAEVLLYKPFVDRHPGLVPPSVTEIRRSYGIGGAATSYSSSLDRLDLAGFTFYHSETNVMLATRGAFADRVDAGNVGMGILRNFVVTFDLSSNALYLSRGSEFDDGRTRV